MTTNLLSVIEQQHKALEMLQNKLTGNVNGADEHCFIISMKNQVSYTQMERVSEAIAAGKQALEQAQGEVANYRLLQSGVDRIESTDEFLSDDTSQWKVDPNAIFSGMLYGGNALRPARRSTHPQATEPAPSTADQP